MPSELSPKIQVPSELSPKIQASYWIFLFSQMLKLEFCFRCFWIKELHLLHRFHNMLIKMKVRYFVLGGDSLSCSMAFLVFMSLLLYCYCMRASITLNVASHFILFLPEFSNGNTFIVACPFIFNPSVKKALSHHSFTLIYYVFFEQFSFPVLWVVTFWDFLT